MGQCMAPADKKKSGKSRSESNDNEDVNYSPVFFNTHILLRYILNYFCRDLSH